VPFNAHPQVDHQYSTTCNTNTTHTLYSTVPRTAHELPAKPGGHRHAPFGEHVPLCAQSLSSWLHVKHGQGGHVSRATAAAYTEVNNHYGCAPQPRLNTENSWSS
jgi:hypothetical protein